MKTTHYILSTFAVAAVAVIAGSCSKSVAHEEAKAPAEKPAIETIVLSDELFETQLQIPGELIAFQFVDLYAKVTGFVKDLKVDIGSEVREGQVLLTLEAPELSSQLSAAESRLKSQEALFTASNANYNRLVETSKTPGTISQNDLDIAEAKKNSDYANLEAARSSFREVSDIRSYLTIRAPFDGVITARNVNLGAYVGPSGKGSELPIFTLQQQKKLRLVLSVPEAYTGYLKENDEVSFHVRTFPSETFRARVKRKSGALDTKLRALRIEADVDNSDGKLLPGTVADVSVHLASAGKSLIVPKTALVNSSEGTFVIKVDHSKAKRVTVRKGLESNGRFEIFGDLAPSDTLLKKASDEIKDGQLLK